MRVRVRGVCVCVCVSNLDASLGTCVLQFLFFCDKAPFLYYLGSPKCMNNAWPVCVSWMRFLEALLKCVTDLHWLVGRFLEALLKCVTDLCWLVGACWPSTAS